jgi:hypothetical protein
MEKGENRIQQVLGNSNRASELLAELKLQIAPLIMNYLC